MQLCIVWRKKSFIHYVHLPENTEKQDEDISHMAFNKHFLRDS